MKSLPDYPEALDLAQQVVPVRADKHDASTIEDIPCADASGRVLAAPVYADRDMPPFNRAMMDGYAVRAAEVGRRESWQVIASIAAGQSVEHVSVPPGECVAIATGAPLPHDVDAVIQHEWSDRGDRAGGDVSFTIDSIEPGNAVHPRGVDAERGDVILDPGTILAAQHLGIAASAGATTLSVMRRPRVVLLTSGDEIVSADADVLQHQVRNSNGPMLADLLERIGSSVLRHEHLPDDEHVTIELVGRALNDADLLITVGGVSAGDRDYFPVAFTQHQVEISLGGAAIQPGRPISIGRRAVANAHGAIVIALPGNPVSALVCCVLFVWPIVWRLLGTRETLPWRLVKLAKDVKPNPRRRTFRPARLLPDGRAEVPTWAGSGDLIHTAATDGIVELTLQAEPVRAGTRVRFLPWPPAH